MMIESFFIACSGIIVGSVITYILADIKLSTKYGAILKKSPEHAVRKTERALLKPIPKVPKAPPFGNALEYNNVIRAELQLSLRLIEEEFNELKEAILTGSVKDVLKEASDLYVVLVRMGSSCGLPIAAATILTSESNETKLADDGFPIFNEHGKYMKGPNYVPPRMDQAYALHHRLVAEGILPKEDGPCVWDNPDGFVEYKKELKYDMEVARGTAEESN